ncbi:MAG: hypothetical protein JXB35_04850 [Anaerolineae bacterium]|nr:hypothetical protein [Anaerolineae bacterium]
MYTLVAKTASAFVVGAMAMLALSFTIYRKSYYYKKAQAEMQGSAGKPGVSSQLVTLAIFLAMVLFFALVDLWILTGASYVFGFLAAYNLALVTLLSLFDALFIDYFVLLVWRPAVLRLPVGQPTRAQMLRHIRLQFTLGWVFKLPIALLGAAVAVLL